MNINQISVKYFKNFKLSVQYDHKINNIMEIFYTED